MGQQTVQLERVNDVIGERVISFVNERIGHTFRMEDLVAHVKLAVPNCAPDSPSRILRWHNRQTGSLRYTLVSRRDSLYRAEPLH